MSASEMAAMITTAASAVCGRSVSSPGTKTSMTTTRPAPTSPVTWSWRRPAPRRPSASRSTEIAKPWNRPAPTLEAPTAIISRFGVHLVAAPGGEAGRRGDGVGQRDEHDADRGGGQRREVARAGPRERRAGKPCGSVPTVLTPSAARSSAAETTVAPTTATSTAGIFFETRGSPSSSASVPRPTSSVVVLVWSRFGEERLDLVDEAVRVGGEAEELGELADDDGDRQPVHVADLDLLGEQVGDEPQLAEPQADLDEADHERQHAGEGDGRGGVVGHHRAARWRRRSAARPTSPGRGPARATARAARTRRGRRWSCRGR